MRTTISSSTTVRALIDRAPSQVRWFVVDASAITDLDYSAARSIGEFVRDPKAAEVRNGLCASEPLFRSDMDRHHITTPSAKVDFCNTSRSHSGCSRQVATVTSTVSTIP